MEEFGPLSLRNGPNRLIIRRLVGRARYADAIIATDTAMVAAVQRNFNVPESKVKIIPNAVDVQRLRNFGIDATQSPEFIIVTIGRMVVNKGYDLLLNALALPDVRANLPQGFRWIHFGDGAERRRIELRSVVLGVPLTVHRGRPDAEVQKALAVADLFVQPSRREGSSLTTLEAMAHGRRIVATAVGGIPDKIRDGATGFLAEISAADIGRCILRALASEHTGPSAREVASREFSRQCSQELYVRLYEQLLR